MEKIILNKVDRIAILTINRPDARNALDLGTYEEFESAIEDVKNDSELRALIITGAGDSFCAGLDLKFAAVVTKMSAAKIIGFIKKLQLIFNFERIKIPVISAVKGYAMGNGCDIALASDFIFAAKDAKFAMTYTNLGLIPDMGGTFRLPKLVGLATARELIMTGDLFDAKRALDIGMVNRVVPVDKLMDETMKFANKLAKRAPLALSMAKSAIYNSLGSDLAKSYDFEAYMQSVCIKSDDVNEAITAFIEKRAPKFKGE